MIVAGAMLFHLTYRTMWGYKDNRDIEALRQGENGELYLTTEAPQKSIPDEDFDKETSQVGH